MCRSGRPAEPGLRRCLIAPVLVRLYSVCGPRSRRWLARLAQRLEGGPFFSATLRDILSEYHGVIVGAYSYGACLHRGAFPAGVRIGRYCSIAGGVQVFLRNHPYERLSTHPFFYNSRYGLVDEDTVESTRLQIGHDAWVGYRAIITPRCMSIGLGAVVGAGAVVTRDVADFAIVAGSPARVIGRRFDESVCDRIRRSGWWELAAEEIARDIDLMTRPLTVDMLRHPLFAERG